MMKSRKFITSVITASFLAAGMLFSGCGKEDVIQITEFTIDMTEVTTEAPTDYLGDTQINTLTINKDGSVIEVSCEDYSEVQYSDEELTAFITDEIEKYNSAHGGSGVELLQKDGLGGLVRIAVKYDSIDVYNDFNNITFVISDYDALICDEVAKANNPVVDEPENTESDAPDYSGMSEEELLEAGISLDDINSGSDVTDSSSETVAETFKTANGEEVTSDKVLELNAGSSVKMIIVDREMNVIIPGGKILYTNSCGTILENTSAYANGLGKAIFVYVLDGKK